MALVRHKAWRPGGPQVPPAAWRAESGQATVEWMALVALLVLVFTAMLLAGVRVPAASLAEAIASKMLCAVGVGSCGEPAELVAEYGPEIAEELRRWAPGLFFERGMSSIPVDFRECRRRSCSDHSQRGRVAASDTGQVPVAFTRVIDCRSGRAADTLPACADPERAGHLYLQYWFYYPDSSTFEGVPVLEEKGFHPHDWESFQVRIDERGRAEARASSHHGHNHGSGAANWASDAGVKPVNAAIEKLGLRPRGGWGSPSGWLFVSKGSHAGAVEGPLHRIGSYTAPEDLHLIPIESIADNVRQPDFDPITPPWRKRLWQDPEEPGTA